MSTEPKPAEAIPGIDLVARIQSGESQYAIVKMDKSNYRDVLATIETKLDTKVQRTEEN